MVKYALISDIHGNYKALEAFLTYIEENPVDGIIALGDYVTDGPYPERTIKYLQEMCEKYTCYFLRGNREEYLLNNTDNKEGWKPSSANGTLYYTFRRLTEADRAFLASFPTEREAAMEGCPPGIRDWILGCPFAPRCGYTRETCHKDCPPLCNWGKENTGKVHRVRCFLAGKGERT